MKLKYTLSFSIILLLLSFVAQAQPDGKALFDNNCASCHHPIKKVTGPALQGITSRAPSKEWIFKWVANPSAMIASGDKYAKQIESFSPTAMTAFPNLKKDEVDAIIDYVENFKEAAAPGPDDNGAKQEDAGGNTWLYVILTIVLLIIALILSQVNRYLNKAANDKAGLPTKKHIPFYRHKAWIALIAVIFIVWFGTWLAKGGINLGRQQNYMPKQPIFYSHKVHAGINQINCLYCHAGAEKSRHAMIPSTNVCMNCHKQINEYTGAETHKLVDLEGHEINGTEEIKKLYSYTGWDAAAGDYKRDAQGNIMAKPFDWIKVHNLPDHVYFNHSLHVVSGKVQCQQCHGMVEEMDEISQFAPLSMGWCINCHRETKVQFESNNYYSIFEKYHQEIKDGKREKGDVRVSDIGGLECQKCHY